jgi:hypothetical protein
MRERDYESYVTTTTSRDDLRFIVASLLMYGVLLDEADVQLPLAKDSFRTPGQEFLPEGSALYSAMSLKAVAGIKAFNTVKTKTKTNT